MQTNDAPVAENVTFIAQENIMVYKNQRAEGVLGGDTDIDGGETSSLTVFGFGVSVDAIISKNTGETITVAGGGNFTLEENGTYVFDPLNAYDHLSVGQTATAVVYYVVVDVYDARAVGAVVITINGVSLHWCLLVRCDLLLTPVVALQTNDLPVAANLTVSTNESDIVFADSRDQGVLAADTDVDDNTAEAARLFVVSFGETPNSSAVNADETLTLASGATMRIDRNGTFSFNPNGMYESLAEGNSTVELVSYVVSDPFGGTDIGILVVNVLGVSPPHSDVVFSGIRGMLIVGFAGE